MAFRKSVLGAEVMLAVIAFEGKLEIETALLTFQPVKPRILWSYFSLLMLVPIKGQRIDYAKL